MKTKIKIFLLLLLPITMNSQIIYNTVPFNYKVENTFKKDTVVVDSNSVVVINSPVIKVSKIVYQRPFGEIYYTCKTIKTFVITKQDVEEIFDLLQNLEEQLNNPNVEFKESSNFNWQITEHQNLVMLLKDENVEFSFHKDQLELIKLIFTRFSNFVQHNEKINYARN